MTTEPTQRDIPHPHSLITGGAGFIGSHLADHLIARGERVTVLDNLSTGSLANILHLRPHPRFQFVEGDVRDRRTVERLAEGSARIFHLAAVVGVQRVLESPLRVVEENFLGTRSVLRAARSTGSRVFVASTSEIYGRSDALPFREDGERVLGPPQMARWSYSTSKAVDEILSFGYARERGARVVVGRFFNTIGRRQTGHYGMVVPRFVEQAVAGRPLEVYGDGSQTRSFCDVRDTVCAAVWLMDDPAAENRVYNIGSEREITIEQLARLVLQAVSPARAARADAIRCVPYASAYPAGYEEFPRRVPDISRVREQVGWEPRRSLDETLDWIAEGLQLAQSA